MSVVDHPGLTNRMVNDPKSIDIADMEIWQSKIMMPQGVTQAVEIAKIKNWGDLTPLYTEGMFAGKEVSRQGDAPIKFMYRDAQGRQDLCQGADRLGELRPGRLQRRYARHPAGPRRPSDHHLGRPDRARVQGQGGDPEHPGHRHHGRHHGDGGGRQSSNTATRAIRRRTSRVRRSRKLIELKKAGHFRALWNTFDELREPDGRRRGGDPVDVVAGCHRGEDARRQVRLPAAEGGLSRLGQRPRH